MARPVPPPYLRTKLIPHAQQVCQLYKAALFDVRSKHRALKPVDPTAPGGVAYQREAQTFDIHLDTWHPLEKLQYPDYFAKREKKKQEFVDRWEKRYGPYKEEPVH